MPVMKMSIAQWHEVPDCARQRDTARRAQRAKSKHLSEYHKTHDYVFAATIDSNIACKLDGHTRDFLWTGGELELPPSGSVQVITIPVKNLQEAKEIYEYLDSPSAVKRKEDAIFGATRENKFLLKSRLLQRCKFNYHLCYVDNGTFGGDTYKLIKKWKQELLDLDSLDLSRKFSTLIPAMLMSIRRDGMESSAPFWKGLDQGLGTKEGHLGYDGIEALSRHMATRASQDRTGGYANVKDMQDRAWFCYDAWTQGKRIKYVGAAKFEDLINSTKKELA